MSDVGGFVDGNGFAGFVLEDDTDFATIVIVDDASADIDVTEG